MRANARSLSLVIAFAAGAAGAEGDVPSQPADHLPAEAVTILERVISNLQISCVQGAVADCQASWGLFNASHILADLMRSCRPPDADPAACQAADQVVRYLDGQIGAMGPRVLAERDADGAAIPLTVLLSGSGPEIPEHMLRLLRSPGVEPPVVNFLEYINDAEDPREPRN